MMEHHDGPTDSAGNSAPHELCVSLVPIFNHLPAEDLITISSKAQMRTFDRGEFIHRAGDRSDHLFIIHRGKVKVYRLSESGKEQLLRILKPGDFIGELALFSDFQHNSYAETLERSQICAIARSDLRALMLSHPSIGLHVMAELAERLSTSEKQTAVIATETIDTRVGLYLASLAEKSNSAEITLPMTRKHLASYLGTTPETISRRFTEFEERGWIAQSGQRTIKVLDLDALLLL